MMAPRDNGNKVNPTLRSRPDGSNRQVGKPLVPVPVASHRVGDGLTSFKAARAELQMILLSAQRELERAKQLRAAAERYQQETQAKARSQAQMLILKARLAIRKEIKEIAEITELNRKTSDEIKKIIDDFYALRNAALTELETQQKFSDAARIKALSLGFQEKDGEPLEDKEDVLACSQSGGASEKEHRIVRKRAGKKLPVS